MEVHLSMQLTRKSVYESTMSLSMKNVESCIRSNLKKRNCWLPKSPSIQRLKSKMTLPLKRSRRKVQKKRLRLLRKKVRIMLRDGKNRKRNRNKRRMKTEEKRRRQRRKKRGKMMNTGKKREKTVVAMLRRQRRKKKLLEGKSMVMKSIDNNLILNGT
jgi:hypothetical protein